MQNYSLQSIRQLDYWIHHRSKKTSRTHFLKNLDFDLAMVSHFFLRVASI